MCVREREKKIESENIKDIYQENTNTPEILAVNLPCERPKLLRFLNLVSSCLLQNQYNTIISIIRPK